MSTDNLDGRFTVKGPLRCAGVGSLVCAQDNKDGARTAIRLIPQLAQGKEAVAAALRMPLHPVLPRALGSGALNDSAWVALDFPEGELLTNRIPLTTPALLTMGSMIAGALTALHQNKIIHGELSSESVLVVPAPGGDRFVLFDAPLVVMNRLTDRRGEERLLSQLTHLVPYLSPERARGTEATEASDIWSLGMVISLASGATAVPGRSTLEKIAAIVTNKWRPAVSSALPIALRLLLTRMLAPEPRDRPSALDAALELEHLCVALTAHPQVAAHPAPEVDTAPVPQARIDRLLEQSKRADPFEALVSNGVTALGPDANAEPTRRVGIPLTAHLRPGHDVTDPHAQLPVPTAPSVPVWVEPPSSEPERFVADAAPIPLLIPAHPSQQRRTPMPLPPILDPQAIAVPPQPMRQHAPAPMPKLSTPHLEPMAHPQTETMRYGALPGAVRPAKVPAVLTEDVAEEAAAARAAVQEELDQTSPIVQVTPEVQASVVAVLPDGPSVHDQAEEAFAADVRRAQKRRYLMLGIAAGVLSLGIGALMASSMFDSEPEVERVQAPASAEAPPVVVAPQTAIKGEAAAARAAAVRAGMEKARLERAAAEEADLAEQADPAENNEPVEAVDAEPVKAEPAKITAKAEP
ncbi:MAG: protein kinase, partial [Myxococcaceae bacterium]|nr:protein kinase [Myxococcaceae bacterium]